MGDPIDLTSPLEAHLRRPPNTVNLLSDSDDERSADVSVIPDYPETAPDDLPEYKPPWERTPLKKAFQASSHVGTSEVAGEIGLVTPSSIDVALEEYIRGRNRDNVCEQNVLAPEGQIQHAPVEFARFPNVDSDMPGPSDAFRTTASEEVEIVARTEAKKEGERGGGADESSFGNTLLDKEAKKDALKRQREEKKAARELERERAKREREEKKLAKQEEKKVKAAERVKLRQMKGNDCMKEIRVLMSKTVAERTLGPQVLIHLKDAEFDFGIESLALEHRQCFCWERYVPPSLDSDMLGQRHKKRKRVSEGRGNVLDVPYILFAFEAEEFVEEVLADKLAGFLREASEYHSDCTLAIMTVGLDRYLTNRERKEFRQNGPRGGGFQRQPIDDFVAHLTTHYPAIRYRAPLDLAEASDVIVNLTAVLAKQFYWPLPNFLTRFGGSNDKGTSSILTSDIAKSLHAVPGVGPNHALSIKEAFPSLGALLAKYTDESRNEASNSSMLADLMLPNARRVGPQVSKRVFRFLTSEDGDQIVD